MNRNLTFSFYNKRYLGTYYNRVEAVNQKYYSVNNKDYAWQEFIVGLSCNFDKDKEAKKLISK